jgi:transposase InsO family protein
MSRRGNCYDNAVMESFFSTVKTELREHFDSDRDAEVALFDYIEVFYNQRRRHSTIGYVSPAAFERQAATRRSHRPHAQVGDKVVDSGVSQPYPTDDRRSWSLL